MRRHHRRCRIRAFFLRPGQDLLFQGVAFADLRVLFREAIEALAKLAVERELGARGLRSIIEEVMLNVMYDIPSRKDVRECIITPGVVHDREEPLLVYEGEAERRNAQSKTGTDGAAGA